jgi:hypothetical protein
MLNSGCQTRPKKALPSAESGSTLIGASASSHYASGVTERNQLRGRKYISVLERGEETIYPLVFATEKACCLFGAPQHRMPSYTPDPALQVSSSRLDKISIEPAIVALFRQGWHCQGRILAPQDGVQIDEMGKPPLDRDFCCSTFVTISTIPSHGEI